MHVHIDAFFVKRKNVEEKKIQYNMIQYIGWYILNQTIFLPTSQTYLLSIPKVTREIILHRYQDLDHDLLLKRQVSLGRYPITKARMSAKPSLMTIITQKWNVTILVKNI